MRVTFQAKQRSTVKDTFCATTLVMLSVTHFKCDFRTVQKARERWPIPLADVVLLI